LEQKKIIAHFLLITGKKLLHLNFQMHQVFYFRWIPKLYSLGANDILFACYENDQLIATNYYFYDNYIVIRSIPGILNISRKTSAKRLRTLKQLSIGCLS
jgi:hypothetical protein